ncbi:DEAD/DEAH box helicase [Nocardioides sp. cx-173]|uniref:DEAD/DEAH box helicase n=1 Tax=Nocardioides sp. cx-173 TaxID=2898796 RepID=UPI001E58A09A|nr:DEAD/DEAH box helicase [Nocardioides sp. cx-173]MCD4523632.1 DEAD/DEAH box helicase [Nocardioides sp. cx-173]UGB42034.1 DEAD/DEAH box helicase [Nocardioides sp. cx-173]
MSFVPVTGPATFRPAEPPREGVVEFSDDRRTVALPIRAALPVLTKAHARDDLHPSVGLLSGAVLLGMRLVAAGRFEPSDTGRSWRAGPLDADDADRVQMLARSRSYDGLVADDAEALVRQVLDAVSDAMPRAAPLATARRARTPSSSTVTTTDRAAGGSDFESRLQARLARHRRTADLDLPQLVTISLRVEADEEELVAGAVRLVLQVHDEQNQLHLCDAATLFTEYGPDASHGFGERARTHASIALRAAADAWPVLDRLLALRVPDQITLDADELVSLLEHGVGALKERGVDVLWPRSLGRDLTATAVLDRAPSGPREEPLQQGLLSSEAMFAFKWQLALHGEPLSEAEMDELAHAAAPVLKLRGSWTVVDPAMAKRARKRLVRTVKPVQAVAAALTGVVQLEPADASGTASETQVVVGASLLKVRDQLRHAATRDPVTVPAGLRATLRDYQRHGLTWLADLTDLGLGACLADDMGLGKTVTLIALHLHRREAGATGPTLVVCPASLLGNWEAEIERFAPGTPTRRFHGGERSLDGLGEDSGFVLTTYGTMRVDHTALCEVDWDLVVADEAQHVKNPQSSTARAMRTISSRARVALTGTPVENNLTELWAILDWATPGLLGSRNAFRKVWAGPIESGLEPTKARQFADLIEPFLLRRRKSDPGIAPELPPKTETDHLLGLTQEQVVLYEAFVRDSMERIERADEEARRGLVLALLTGLKQICNHPAHFLKQSTGRLAGRSEKLELLDELLGTVLAEDGAVLVFTQYVAMARLLETHLAKAGVPHQFLHGGTPVREREAMVKRFQAGEVPVFLLSLKAGGTGLNLTRADHVVHVDRWWNPAVEEQATDRAYRIGQTRPVQVHRMITQGTIEEKIAELLARKRSLADSVLGRGEAALTELGNDELRNLVTLRRPT